MRSAHETGPPPPPPPPAGGGGGGGGAGAEVAGEAPPLTDELAVGTQIRFEADAAQRTWEEIREAYPALDGVGNAELAAAYATLTDEEVWALVAYVRNIKNETITGGHQQQPIHDKKIN